MDPAELINHWGYVALFLLVILGNMGLPAARGDHPRPRRLHGLARGARLPIVLAIGIVSAAGGDNIGYWLGHRYGRATLERHSRWLLGHPGRLAMMQDFVARRGSLAVFVARFVPGLRFMAGPLAGALGLPFSSFLIANFWGRWCTCPSR